MTASCQVLVLFSLLTFVHAAGNSANIAVVGAGPHGLIAALELAQLGHSVTVFEKETVVLPIIQSLELNSVVYEYLGQALLPAANSHGSGPPAALLSFAEKYGQPLEPLPAAITTLSFDSVVGVNPVPSSWLPFLADAADQLELLQELAAGYAVLLELESFPPNPSGVLDSGVAASNQTFADWAKEISLPAFTDFIELVFNSALSGPVADTIAANILSPSRLYIPGGLRQAFLLQGLTHVCTAHLHAVHITCHDALHSLPGAAYELQLCMHRSCADILPECSRPDGCYVTS